MTPDKGTGRRAQVLVKQAEPIGQKRVKDFITRGRQANPRSRGRGGQDARGAGAAHKWNRIGGSAAMTLLRKHGLWLVFATMAGIVGAWLIYASRPTVYLSTAQVDVEPHVVALTTPIVPNMGTEEQVATSGVVLASTARALGAKPRNLATDLSAKVTGTANIMSINCTMPAAAAAQRCAAAAAAGYVAFRNQVGSSKIDQAHDPLHVTLVTAATLPASPAGAGEGHTTRDGAGPRGKAGPGGGERLVALLAFGRPGALVRGRRLIAAGAIVDPARLSDPDTAVRDAVADAG